MKVTKGYGPQFEGAFAPTKLPRERPAPVSLQFGFRVQSARTPTRVTALNVGFPPSITIDSDGLPTCNGGRIRDLALDRARDACGSALVGEGSFAARVSIPGTVVDCFRSRVGAILAFNSTSEGHPAILLDLAIGAPLPDTFSVVFRKVKAVAGFPTAYVGVVPRFAGGYGSISSLSLNLRRRFRVDGEHRSYLSANCPAPKGFGEINFPFARLGYSLEDGTKASSQLVRRCSVRVRPS